MLKCAANNSVVALSRYALPEYILSANHTRSASTRLPETTPSNVVLTQILQLRSFNNEFVHLVDNIQLLIRLEISPRKLLRNPVENLDCSSVLTLSLFSAIGLNTVWHR